MRIDRNCSAPSRVRQVLGLQALHGKHGEKRSYRRLWLSLFLYDLSPSSLHADSDRAKSVLFTRDYLAPFRDSLRIELHRICVEC